MNLNRLINSIIIFSFLSGCSAFGPYQSSPNRSFASNVAHAAGIKRYDVSQEEFIETYGQAQSTLDHIDDMFYTLDSTYQTASNISSLLVGTINLTALANISFNKVDAENRQLMFAWIPKGDLKTKKDAWNKLAQTLTDAVNKTDLPAKPHETVTKINSGLSREGPSEMSYLLFGDVCKAPFKCWLQAKNFDLPEEVILPDFLGGGPGYFFEIHPTNRSQYFSFNCTSIAQDFSYVGNAEDRNKYRDEYNTCAQAMNNSTILLSKNMPEWFFLYRPQSQDYLIAVPHILWKGKPYFFVKPTTNTANQTTDSPQQVSEKN